MRLKFHEGDSEMNANVESAKFFSCLGCLNIVVVRVKLMHMNLDIVAARPAGLQLSVLALKDEPMRTTRARISDHWINGYPLPLIYPE